MFVVWFFSKNPPTHRGEGEVICEVCVDSNNGAIRTAVHAGKHARCIIIEFPTDYQYDTN